MSLAKPSIPFLLALLFTMLAYPLASIGEVYKWTDGEGNLHFGDRPPASASPQQVELEINTYSAPEIVPSRAPEQPPQRSRAPKVVMYSAEWCGVCKRARKWFKANKIPFSEYDVEKSSRGRQAYQALDGNAVPIILVGDERLNGFSPQSFLARYRP